MSDGRFAVIDPAAGISGDMLLGALVGAGAPVAWLEGLPARLGIPEVAVSIEPVDRCGVRALKVRVQLPGGVEEAPAELVGHHHHGHGHAHDHAHARDPEHHAGGGDHGHRHVGDLIAMVMRAPLSDWVRARAVRAFELLGEAEGRVHGLPATDVPLHEVGALDALVDIVGGVEGFEQLGVRRIFTRPVALGSGWVRAAHGVMAVPTPATALLASGLEIGPDGPVTGEATTPTGAALLRALAEGPPPARWRMSGAVGWGAGGRNPEGYANVLRLWLGSEAPEAARVDVLAADLDDLSPEYLEPLRERLFDAGALDVQIWTTQAKKGRTGFRVEIVAAPGAADAVGEALFRHSTTAGLRSWTADRRTLARREVTLNVSGITVRVKIVAAPGGLRAKAEYEDVVEVARRTGRPAPEVARDLQTLAMDLAERGEATEHQHRAEEYR
jgi:hypothetical protein